VGLTIRPAMAEDVPQILEFIRALAKYEREPDAVTATEADLLRDGFGPNPSRSRSASVAVTASGSRSYFANARINSRICGTSSATAGRIVVAMSVL
jgi:hypothetical protein